jgi:hypothetical protein
MYRHGRLKRRAERLCAGLSSHGAGRYVLTDGRPCDPRKHSGALCPCRDGSEGLCRRARHQHRKSCTEGNETLVYYYFRYGKAPMLRNKMCRSHLLALLKIVRARPYALLHCRIAGGSDKEISRTGTARREGSDNLLVEGKGTRCKGHHEHSERNPSDNRPVAA